MTEPVIAQKFSCSVELEPGDYYWCACGLSKNQPFCDGSHKETDIEPLKFTVEEAGKYKLCACKRTGRAPFCDSTHLKL